MSGLLSTEVEPGNRSAEFTDLCELVLAETGLSDVPGKVKGLCNSPVGEEGLDLWHTQRDEMRSGSGKITCTITILLGSYLLFRKINLYSNSVKIALSVS